jgi:hypothetical protein
VREKLPEIVAARETQWLQEPGNWEIEATTENCHLISVSLRAVFTQCDLTDKQGTPTIYLQVCF